MADDDEEHSETLVGKNAAEAIALIHGAMDDEAGTIEVVKQANGKYSVTSKGVPDQ